MFSLATVFITVYFTCCFVLTNTKPTNYDHDRHLLQLLEDLTSRSRAGSIPSNVGDLAERSLAEEDKDAEQLLESLLLHGGNPLTNPSRVVAKTSSKLLSDSYLQGKSSSSSPNPSSWQSVLQAALGNQGDGGENRQPWTESSSSVEKRSVGVRSRCCYVDVFCYSGCFRELHNRARYKRQIAAKLQR